MLSIPGATMIQDQFRCNGLRGTLSFKVCIMRQTTVTKALGCKTPAHPECAECGDGAVIREHFKLINHGIINPKTCSGSKPKKVKATKRGTSPWTHHYDVKAIAGENSRLSASEAMIFDRLKATGEDMKISRRLFNRVIP